MGGSIESKQPSKSRKIAVIGLGYVGLPLAARLARFSTIVGFDHNKVRTSELRNGKDRTGEVGNEVLEEVSNRLHFTDDESFLDDADFFILTLPTPIDDSNKPDLTPLLTACATVGRHLQRGDIIVIESTVYPGATEERCVPELERESGLKWREDFHVGYSPERINPGDPGHSVENIVKVVSGDDNDTLEVIDQVYRTAITAGIFRASSIKVAEAAKVIENCQRDINIAFVNELAMLFDKLGIETSEVLAAAETKWNFLPFRPGLVGGHCIGVDPYYLTYRAEQSGYHPEIILAGRRINERMGKHVAIRVMKTMVERGLTLDGARVLLLGFTFKENCRDIRNTRVIDIYLELVEFGFKVDIVDPVPDAEEAMFHYGVKVDKAVSPKRSGTYAAAIHAVAHPAFDGMDWPKLVIKNGFVFDVKGVLSGPCVIRL